MANKSTKQCRELDRQHRVKNPDGLRVTHYTRTTHAADSKNSKKHVVEVLVHEHGRWAFQDELGRKKNKKIYQEAKKPLPRDHWNKNVSDFRK